MCFIFTTIIDSTLTADTITYTVGLSAHVTIICSARLLVVLVYTQTCVMMQVFVPSIARRYCLHVPSKTNSALVHSFWDPICKIHCISHCIIHCTMQEIIWFPALYSVLYSVKYRAFCALETSLLLHKYLLPSIVHLCVPSGQLFTRPLLKANSPWTIGARPLTQTQSVIDIPRDDRSFYRVFSCYERAFHRPWPGGNVTTRYMSPKPGSLSKTVIGPNQIVHRLTTKWSLDCRQHPTMTLCFRKESNKRQ